MTDESTPEQAAVDVTIDAAGDASATSADATTAAIPTLPDASPHAIPDAAASDIAFPNATPNAASSAAPNTAATDANATTSALDKIKPPAGMIIPPPGEIREAVEKTAGYVMRGGPGLEQRIRTNHGSNPKFSFLMSDTDPYNAYYKWRKEEIKAGRGTTIAAGRIGQAPAVAAKEERPAGPEKPADFLFSARMPRMSAKDLDILRLTALFAAKNGRQFLTQLTQREAGSAQFQFLVPNHTFHIFFQSLVDQYSVLLRESGVDDHGTMAQQDPVSKLKRNCDNKFHILARAKQRAKYAQWQETERQKKEEEEQKKKEEFDRINWQDFVVVETIVFSSSDNHAKLPPPTTLNDIQYASLEEKNKISISSNFRIEEAFPFDETSYNASPPVTSTEPPRQPAGSKPAQTSRPDSLPTPPPHSVPASSQPSALPRSEQDEEARQIHEREEARARMQKAHAEAKGGSAAMKIRDNYVPRTAAARPTNKQAQMALCPNCKEQIPLDELDAHMKIELLDPRWKEQKAKAESRYATTNLSTADVANNLKRLASQRSDVFDSVTGQPMMDEELARKKKPTLSHLPAKPVEPISATVPGANPQPVNVEEQIRVIHQKFSEKR